MSFFGDALGFEAFHAGDLWDRLKKDPKRIVLGVDPLSTKAWNGILGRKDEPLVDQLGGAYGGHTISAFGNNDGGVYKRAREAGIDTGAGEKMQDAAHVIASIYGANGLYGATGGTTGSGVTGPWQTAQGLLSKGAPSQDLGIFSNNGDGGMSQVGGGNAGVLAQQGGIGGGAGYGAASPSSLGIQDYMKMAQGMGGQQQGQQQPAPQAPPAEQSDAFRQLLARQARAQMLRRKLNRTPQENQELRDLTQGLLSNA